MIKIFNTPELADISYIINRNSGSDTSEIEARVKAIVDAIRSGGDAALLDAIKRYDNIEYSSINDIIIPQEKLKEAYDALPRSLQNSLKEAAKNIKSFHRAQMPKSWTMKNRDGAKVGQIIKAIDSVGIYVPGGRANYPSTVLMNAIPAHVAGVKRVVMITPPHKKGVNQVVLGAAYVAGVTTVYTIGGAYGVGALAFGTQTIEKVAKITGPGNIYVALAKKYVFGSVGIDMIAGPSEVTVIADDTAHPDYIAADMLAQAEHDPLASSVLITTSAALADKVAHSINEQVQKLPKASIATESIKNYGAIIVLPDIAAAIKLANIIAPEHLELSIDNPEKQIDKINNAGAIFVGHYTPEPVGDYWAGPNHTLPTAGSARWSSALSVDDFLKKISLIKYNKKSLKKIKDSVIELAKTEELDAHANSIAVRFNHEEGK